MLVDTHAHLNFPDYQKDLERVIKRSIKAGVDRIICVSSNLADSQKAIKIAKKYEGIVFAAVGLHPHQTDPENTESLEKQINKLKKIVKDKKVVAIGECGLDYSPAPPKEKSRTKNEQLFLLESQIKMAQEANLPLLIHCREAFQDLISTLKDESGLRGVFHCYSAGKKGISQVEKLGFYFGIGGNLTYDVGLQNVFKLIPLEKILLETDCPFLAPHPKRGQRNEPENVKTIAQFLASLKEASLKKVAKMTSQNAENLFKLPPNSDFSQSQKESFESTIR